MGLKEYKLSIVLSGMFVIILTPFIVGAYLLWNIADVTLVLVVGWMFINSLMNLLHGLFDIIFDKLTHKSKKENKNG